MTVMSAVSQTVSFLRHPFKIALMIVRRTFGRSRVPGAIEFDGFRNDNARYYDGSGGERIWLIYRIKLSGNEWWRCIFTDCRLAVDDSKKLSWELPYQEVDGVALPDKSEIVLRMQEGKEPYNKAQIHATGGKEYMVLGGNDESGMTDVYMWHSFVSGIRTDRNRQEF